MWTPILEMRNLKSNCWAGKLAGRLKVSNSDSNENESGLRSMHPESDAHGHDDVAVAIGFVGEGAHLSGRLFVFQFDTDGAFRGGSEKVEHVTGIEADGDGVALIFLVDIFLGFTVFGAGSGNFDAFLGDGKFYGMRALVGELRYAADGVGEFCALEDDTFVVVAGKHSFVVRELAGENAGDEQAVAGLEEEMAFVFCEFHLCIGACSA